MNYIEELESSPTLSNLNILIDDKKNELQDIRNIKLKGYMIRSKTQQIDEGKRPTKYFCALESKNFLDKTIKRVRTENNKIITNQKAILSSLQTYYQELFRNRDSEQTNINLNDENKLSIEGELTLEEIGIALKNMKNEKSPGLDGFTSEFFKFF